MIVYLGQEVVHVLENTTVTFISHLDIQHELKRDSIALYLYMLKCA